MQSSNLARHIVNMRIELGKPINNFHLQMVLYCIQRDALSRDEVAFHSDIEAWRCGPVVRNVSNEYCGYGVMDITIPTPGSEPTDMDEFSNRLCDAPQSDLRSDVTKPGGAWDRTMKQWGSGKVIPLGWMRDEVVVCSEMERTTE